MKNNKIIQDLEAGKENAYQKREYYRNVFHKAIIHEAAAASSVARHQVRYWDEIYKHLTQIDYIKRNLNHES